METWRFMAVKPRFVLSVLLICCALLVHGQTTQAQRAAEEWLARFDGNALDETKWERFSLEGEPGKTGVPLGYANLTVLFDDSGRNRVEWILTSEGVFEAWAIVDGVSSRIDNHKLGTKTPNPTVGIVRRGDDFLFMLNGQMGMQKTVKNLPHDFWVMLYGFGSSENDWSSVRVATMQQAH